MLKKTIASTNAFIERMPKEQRKAYGQFFTTELTAQFMASLFDIDISRSKLRILDAGAGTGVLAAALLERLRNLGFKGKVCLVCYETDEAVLPVLERNLESMQDSMNLTFEIRKDNYLTSSQHEESFDLIIGNPPYKKIGKSAAEAKALSHVCHGAPNLYFLFWTKALEMLSENQELVYIVPRSWTSGAYFAKFREYLFAHCVITHLHLFGSRDKVFGGESVLQETMIVKVKKTTKAPKNISITSSSSSEFCDFHEFKALYNVVVAPNHYVFLITDEKEAHTLSRLSKLNSTLASINHPMKTGIIVDFRTKEVLRDRPVEGTYPLLFSHHIKDGRVVWPAGKESEYICTDRGGLLQDNTNYLIVKRFTTKEEKRRLQCGIYLKSDHPEFSHISTQNKVNYIRCETPELAYGMFVLFNSEIYDTYYRVLNGSTQVNSTEINNMPVPDLATITAMGRLLIGQDLTSFNCNQIISQWIK